MNLKESDWYMGGLRKEKGRRGMIQVKHSLKSKQKENNCKETEGRET